MKNIIKILCTVLSACVVLSVFAGCQNNKKPAETEDEQTVMDALPVLVPANSLDLNSDGDVNNKDVVIIFRKLAVNDPTKDERYDLNGDGELNNKDIASLFRHLTTLR
ncbi:MAG: hypothetical protein IJT49_08470 [Clostridia bacterium]|nr:hypothetical protein [Clostridia bacterium]